MVNIESFFFSKEFDNVLPTSNTKNEQKLTFPETFKKVWRSFFTHAFVFLLLAKNNSSDNLNKNTTTSLKDTSYYYSKKIDQSVGTVNFFTKLSMVWQRCNWQEVCFCVMCIPLILYLGFITIFKPKRNSFVQDQQIYAKLDDKSLFFTSTLLNIEPINENKMLMIHNLYFKLSSNPHNFSSNGQRNKANIYSSYRKIEDRSAAINSVGSIRHNVVGIQSLSKQKRENFSFLLDNPTFF